MGVITLCIMHKNMVRVTHGKTRYMQLRREILLAPGASLSEHGPLRPVGLSGLTGTRHPGTPLAVLSLGEANLRIACGLPSSRPETLGPQHRHGGYDVLPGKQEARKPFISRENSPSETLVGKVGKKTPARLPAPSLPQQFCSPPPGEGAAARKLLIHVWFCLHLWWGRTPGW